MKKKLLLSTILIALLAAVPMATLTVANNGATQPTTEGKVYTMDNAMSNNAWQFDRMSDGSLMLAGNFSTMGSGTDMQLDSQGAVTLSSDGEWLFVVNAGSDEITVFHVNDTGLMVADKVDSHGMAPISVTVNGNWVYVLNAGSATDAGNIAGFMVNTTGQLTYIEGSTQPLSGMNGSEPEQIGFSPDGAMLVVVEKGSNMIDVYTVAADGIASAPMTQPSVGDAPFGFAFTSTGFLVMSEAASNSMSSFTWTSNGSLRTISGALPDFGEAACWVAITPDDRWAYTTNTATGTISTYAIANNGVLLLTSSIAATLPSLALDMAISSDGNYLYALGGNNIIGYKIYPDDGGLWQVTSVPGLPESVTGVAAT
jgi:6-phosphogluconolactonase (cycloisomerase 2 family)